MFALEEISFLVFFFLGITGIVMVILAGLAFYRSQVRGAYAYAMMSLSIATYTIFYAFELVAGSLDMALYFSDLQYIGISMLPVFIIAFCVQFTGIRNRISTAQWVLLFLIPVTVLLLKFTNEHHFLLYKDVAYSRIRGLLILQITPGIFYYVNIIYSNLIVVLTIVILIREFRISSNRRERRQIRILFLGLLAPWLAHLQYQFGLSPAGVDTTPFGFAFTAILYGYLVIFSRIFDLRHMVYERIFEGITDSIIVIDEHGMIVNINASAIKNFSSAVKPSPGIHIKRLFRHSHSLTVFLENGEEATTLLLETRDGLRSFFIKRSTFLDASLKLQRTVITFSDISRVKATEEALKVKTRELDDYFNTGLDMLCILDGDGRFLHINPEWERTLGYGYDALSYKRATDFLAHQDKHVFMEALTAHQVPSATFSCLVRFRTVQGDLRWLEWRGRRHTDSYYASVRDVTYRVTEQEMMRAMISFTEYFLQPLQEHFDYQQITDLFIRISGARIATINLYDRGGRSFRVLSCSADVGFTSPDFSGMSFPLIASRRYPEGASGMGMTSETTSWITRREIGRTDTDTTDSLEKSLLEATDIDSSIQSVQVMIHGSGGVIGDITYLRQLDGEPEREDLIMLFARQTGLFLAKRAAEEESKSEKVYFETLFESAPAGIVILDHEDRILRCNQRFLMMFGYNIEEVQGRFINKLIVPQYLLDEANSFTNQVSHGQEIKRETIRIRKDGTPLDVSILGRPVELMDGTALVYGIYIDISEQVSVKQTLISRQQELQHALAIQKLVAEMALALNATENLSERIESVLASIGSMADVSRVYIFENDVEGVTTHNTFEWCASGVTPQKDALQQVHYADLPVFYEQMLSKGIWVGNDLSEFDEPTRTFLEAQQVQAIVLVALTVGGKYYGFMGFDECRNTRVWGATELELLRVTAAVLSNTFERAQIERAMLEERDRANLANIAKSEFLANMSHEIRTPMNAILGFSESLYDQLTESEHRGMLQSVLSSGRSLLALLNDILDLSKIESGRLELSTEPFDLQNLVQEVLVLFRERAERRGIQLLFETEEKFPEIVILDEIRIRQVLFNLIGNAVKFTQQGHVRIGLKGDRVGEGLFDVHISIEDTGIGIPSEQLETIFDPFIQVSGRTSREYEGTGLGLSICRRLIQKMEGELNVESTLGSGSIFTILLKGIRGEQVSTRIHAQRDTGESPVFEHVTAVIIDDVSSNLLLMDRFMRTFGFTTYKAVDGEEGLALIKRYIPDIVVTDIRMPKMDGFALVSAVKQDALIRHIPVLGCTAALIELKASHQANLFDGLIMKPVMKEELLRELRRFVKDTGKGGTGNSKESEEFSLAGFRPPPDEHLEEVLAILSEEFLPEWEEFRNQLVLFRIETFAKNLTTLAKKHNFAFLEHYGDILSQNVQDINLDQILYLLDMYPGIVSQLQEHNKNLK
jgi:PAS domain S-box-containing protein